MKRETIGNILTFLKEKEGKELPNHWNIIERLETHPDDVQFRYEGDLNLNNSNITKLPNDLYVEGNLYLYRNKQLTKLPNDLYVEFNLNLRDCGQLTELPDDLFVGGSLILIDSNITELPYNLYVGSHLYIGGTPLANNYTDDEIIEMIDSKDGTLIGDIRKYT